MNWLFLVAGTESDIACQCANVRVVEYKVRSSSNTVRVMIANVPMFSRL